MFENRVMKRLFEPNKQKQDIGGNKVMSVTICAFHILL